jgi:ATPase subunit of ABC transporter with duplicated ATPase domains
MTHHPIYIRNIALSFSEKICFEHFSAAIHPGNRIAITGSNGQGKSMLLKIIQGLFQPTSGTVNIPDALAFAYVPQMIGEFSNLSGSERFLRALSHALALKPDVLCLDEPTNHLDIKNRRSLLAMLENTKSTLIVISHDRALLRCGFDKLWHIEEKKIHKFLGSFDDFEKLLKAHYEGLLAKKQSLKREHTEAHLNLMREQSRAKKKKAYGEKKYDGDKLALRSAQGRGQLTANKNRKRLAEEAKTINEEYFSIRLPEIIKPNFVIYANIGQLNRPVISIVDGSCGYNEPIVSAINLQICPGEKLAITGPNGSGKTTLARAIMGHVAMSRQGKWTIPPQSQIGYLDQHYGALDPELTPTRIIENEQPLWSRTQCREHLNNFLFRKNDEVNTKIGLLSGGEKARLSLALIATKTPTLLIVDEITNNLDMRTRQHVIEILNAYPGAIMAISHDDDFLRAIGAFVYPINNKSLASLTCK